MNARSIPRTTLLALSLAALLGGGVSASDETTIRIVNADQAEVLVLRDLDQSLPIGETRSFSTESGRSVIVGRSDDGLLIDIDGDLTEIKLPSGAPEAHGDGTTREVKVWVAGGESEAKTLHIDKRVAFVGAGDGEPGEAKRVIMIKSGEDAPDIAEALAAAGIDPEQRERILVRIQDGEAETSSKQVTVTRRVHKSD